MRLEINADDVEGMRVDRDGIAHHYPEHTRQGFVVGFGGLTLCFDDEADAARIARAILCRLGEIDSPQTPPQPPGGGYFLVQAKSADGPRELRVPYGHGRLMSLRASERIAKFYREKSGGEVTVTEFVRVGADFVDAAEVKWLMANRRHCQGCYRVKDLPADFDGDSDRCRACVALADMAARGHSSGSPCPAGVGQSPFVDFDNAHVAGLRECVACGLITNAYRFDGDRCKACVAAAKARQLLEQYQSGTPVALRPGYETVEIDHFRVCEKCGYTFAKVFRAVEAEGGTRCPSCHSEFVRKLREEELESVPRVRWDNKQDIAADLRTIHEEVTGEKPPANPFYGE